MLSPSDFNNAVPQFTNGDYASNPINPQYIAEPGAEDYNRGTEPLQTLPAQWWNWFLNRFTNRFNKVNVYVKNIFNELAQVLSIFNITPDGTEATPTTSQLKTVFECYYPQYVKTAASLVGTETTVNGHPLSSNVTVTRSDLGLGTSATVNTGTVAGCIPTVGTALGTTNNNILVTDSTGKLKPSGITVGTAAGCDATAFRSSTWTPALVECANRGKNGSSYSAFGSNAFNSTAFTTCTGTVTQVKIGSTAYNPSSGVISLPAYPSTPAIVCCAKCNGSGTEFGGAATRGVYTLTAVGTLGYDTAANRTKVPDIAGLAYWNGAYQGTSSNLRYFCGGTFGSAAACAATAFRASTWTPSCVACAGWAGCSCRMYDATARACACIQGRIDCCSSSSVENCFLYSCSGLWIRPTSGTSSGTYGTTHIVTYAFDGSKTSVCALRKKLYDMFYINSTTCYCYQSQYACTAGEPVTGYVCNDGKRVPISGVKFTDSYNGTIFLNNGSGSTYVAGLYKSCGACLICNHPGITCLVITTLFSPFTYDIN